MEIGTAMVRLRIVRQERADAIEKLEIPLHLIVRRWVQAIVNFKDTRKRENCE